MSKIEVNQISSQCGSTLTIGQSGDTVTLAAGATQTGFGRTGTVDWDTTAKTTNFTAVSGTGYFVNTTSGAITLTLPASPSAGDIVSFKDYAYTFATNNLTVARNGSPIGGANIDNVVYSVNGTSKTFIYVDGTKGWLITNESTDTSTGVNPLYVTATGGTITTCGDYKIHTFTGPGTFCVSCAGNPAGSALVDYMVVAGGGSGGGSFPGAPVNDSGAGGAGGYRESSGAASGCYTRSPLGACVSGLAVTATGYPIVIGGGGAASPNGRGSSGSNSSFSTITSTGGGAGGAGNACGGAGTGLDGGSGGGVGPSGTTGQGNTPPVSPPQGNPGGNPRGSGGGATGAGSAFPTAPGGAAATSAINGTPTARAGGGGGTPGGTATGGGGPGGTTPGGQGTPGTTNTGGGGGAKAYGSGCVGGPGSTGGSGIVIIRYKYQ